MYVNAIINYLRIPTCGRLTSWLITVHIVVKAWGVLPYKGLTGMCGQPGYVFWDFCLKQGINVIIFCLEQGVNNINFCVKQGW